MTSNIFLFSDPLTAERLAWIGESLKHYFVSLHPDALRHPSRAESPFFVFFLTGDALYSLHEEESTRIWDIILSLPSVWLVCDRTELNLRGLSVAPLMMKYPETVFEAGKENTPRSFWGEVLRFTRQLEPSENTLGFLQISSPYMNRSCRNSVSCLIAAAGEKMAPELYACLDGVHVAHDNQRPGDGTNIGAGLQGIAELARKNDRQFQLLACRQSAAARGYNTLDDGKGIVISACTIEPCRIRALNVIIDRFRRAHGILAESAGAIDIQQARQARRDIWEKNEPTPPSLVIVLTRKPYGTGQTVGGVSFAIASAHHGIATRVIFIEDGIYALTGTQHAEPDDIFSSIQQVINAVGGNENLEFYAYLPSFQTRNSQKNKRLNAVLDISQNDLSTLLFSPPRGVVANHQRILFF